MAVLNRKKAPDFKKVTEINFHLPETKKLSNGIPVIQYDMGSQDLVKIEFLFPAGSKYQLKPLVANFTSAMLKEGTVSKNSLEIANALDYYGAYFETQLLSDFSSVTLYTLNKHLGKVLPILRDVLINSVFPEEEFEKILNIKKQSFIINQEKVETLSSVAFSKLLLKGTKYSQQTELASFDKISLEDCRTFFKKHYHLGDATIFVAGKIDSSLFLYLEEMFGSEKMTQNQEDFSIGEGTYLPSLHSIIKPKAIQTSFRIGRPTIGITHPDYNKMNVMNTIFGGYFGSRLMTNIREEKGYTYGIGSTIITRIENNTLVIYTEVGTEVAQLALDEIRKEIITLQTVPVSKEELTKVKNYLLGNLLENSDGAFAMIQLYKTLYFNNLPNNHWEQYISDINATTSDDILKLAKTYLSDLTIVAAGSVKVS